MSFFRDVWLQKRPVCSIEFFPPKNDATEKQFLQTAEALQDYAPDFVSMTYGAGGTSRERSLGYGLQLVQEFGYTVLPHLTCVGHSKNDLRQILGSFKDAGFKGIMALRGDPPKGESSFNPHPDGLRHASDLVRFIRSEHSSFALGVAGYPETHPEASSPKDDLDHLAFKVRAGADFITTQLFFDNEEYFRFAQSCGDRSIDVPILPGILPAVSWKQVSRFCDLCGSSIPSQLAASLENVAGDEKAEAEVGISWAHGQVLDLLNKGAPGFHLYILNRSGPALELMRRLRSDLGDDFRTFTSRTAS
ncbi:MAG: methylenetetrahydrofolate reductase [NAD(P)H] [Verrucomicrobiota bacterium]